MENKEKIVTETVKPQPTVKPYQAPVSPRLRNYRSYDEARDAGCAGRAYRERCRENAWEDAQRC